MDRLIPLYIEHGLESVQPGVERALNTAVYERRTAGLDVPEFDIEIVHYNIQHARAAAIAQNDKYTLSFNALNYAQFYHPYLAPYIESIILFLDRSREFLNDAPAQAGYLMIDDPEKTIAQFEDALQQQNQFDAYKKDMEEQGLPYEEYRAWLIEMAPSIGATFEFVMPTVVEQMENLDARIIAHEMDHISMYKGNFYKQYADAREQYALARLHDKPDDEIAKRASTFLDRMVQTLPMLEARGFFFSFLPMDYRRHADAMVAQVSDTFIDNYVARDAYLLVNVLADMDYAEVMDDETDNYLRWALDGDENIEWQSKEVNFDLANEILYERLPEIRKTMIHNTVRSAKAVATALRLHPRRLMLSQVETSLDDVIDVLEGR